MYAIINQKTMKYVKGTDKRYNPPHQITSKTEMLIYPTAIDAILDMKTRKCGKNYRVCEVEVTLKRIYD